MPRQRPEVIAGKREPRSTRIEAMQKVEAADPERVQVPPVSKSQKGAVVYLSKFPNYRVQITSPGDHINPATGQRTIVRGIVVKFKQGRYINDLKDKTSRKLVDETLQNNSRFGVPGSGCDFWLASAQETAIKEAQLREAKATLESLPEEVVAEFVSTLKRGDKGDHALPTA
jgi:hypothetical protein